MVGRIDYQIEKFSFAEIAPYTRFDNNSQADTLEEACELIDWYPARWEIELFFFPVLKEGCRVERLQLGNKDRLETALALYSIW